jgi:tripeptidyl-peptidase-1
MRFSTVGLVAALAVCAAAVPSPSAPVLHEKRHYTPAPWTKRDRLASDATVPVRIGLRQSNLDKGYDFLMEV